MHALILLTYKAHFGAARQSSQSPLQIWNLLFPLFLKAAAGRELGRFSLSNGTKMQQWCQGQVLERGKQEQCCPAQSTPIFLSASVFANFINDFLRKRRFLSGLARKPLYSFFLLPQVSRCSEQEGLWLCNCSWASQPVWEGGCGYISFWTSRLLSREEEISLLKEGQHLATVKWI